MLAYLDSFAGPVACKILSMKIVDLDGVKYVEEIEVKITAVKNRSYKKGDIYNMSAAGVFPRNALGKSKFGYVVKPFTWKTAAPEFFKGS